LGFVPVTIFPELNDHFDVLAKDLSKHKHNLPKVKDISIAFRRHCLDNRNLGCTSKNEIKYEVC